MARESATMAQRPRPEQAMSFSWRQYAHDHPRVVDVCLAALLLLAVSGPAVLNSDLSHTDDLSWWTAVPLAVVGALALLWRRGHPRTVVLVNTVCASAAGGFGYLVTPLLLAPVMVALYELAVQVPGRTTRLHYLAATASIAGSALVGDDYGYPWFLTVLNPVLFLLLPVALAESTRLRHDYLSAVKARAEYAERNRENEARHRVAEERVRIARDLHDVVAHHLALANAQAGTAAYLADTRPEQIHRMLTALTATTSAALRELKTTVGLLRHPHDDTSPLDPAPGLDQLPELTTAFATAGLEVNVLVDGEERPLSPGVDLTAYRIVQEALTNVTKHAATTTASLRLAYHEDRLTITITNDTSPDVPTLARPGVGYGLLGMRERAHTAGGRFEAGPAPDGRFTVTTELPVRHWPDPGDEDGP